MAAAARPWVVSGAAELCSPALLSDVRVRAWTPPPPPARPPSTPCVALLVRAAPATGTPPVTTRMRRVGMGGEQVRRLLVVAAPALRTITTTVAVARAGRRLRGGARPRRVRRGAGTTRRAQGTAKGRGRRRRKRGCGRTAARAVRHSVVPKPHLTAVRIASRRHCIRADGRETHVVAVRTVVHARLDCAVRHGRMRPSRLTVA